ncbi:hypothetical protein [Halopiger xanaduensis]|uniref:Uncharacterized protein n=1 Tax=Halopiger xanaduensis (strain DSM 18323 / JCM 14033 / SH-6) TaxID=797210 RepID=F8D4C2_HALXS|nr:hypothetical protein [Halopiger xanaduensis]AEH38662.1 hypothetical protein Halxa_4057 [Halopiger xanaduensis SH-6]
MIGRALERFRRPEYTGANRCLPCTALNVGLVAAVAVALAIVDRPVVAAGTVLVGAAAIWLRGYAVPYTPAIGPRLAARMPGDPFGHADDPATGQRPSGLAEGTDGEAIQPTGDEIVTALLEAGVVVPVPAADDADGETDTDSETPPELTLADSFREDWRAEMARLRDRDLEELAAVADDLTVPSVAARASHTVRTETIVLEGDEVTGGVASLTRPIAVAELGAARALESRIDDRAIRLAAGRPLRSLLASCPRCGSELTITQTSCCGEVTPIGETPPEKLVCPDCDVRYFTYE